MRNTSAHQYSKWKRNKNKRIVGVQRIPLPVIAHMPDNRKAEKKVHKIYLFVKATVLCSILFKWNIIHGGCLPIVFSYHVQHIHLQRANFASNIQDLCTQHFGMHAANKEMACEIHFYTEKCMYFQLFACISCDRCIVDASILKSISSRNTFRDNWPIFYWNEDWAYPLFDICSIPQYMQRKPDCFFQFGYEFCPMSML